VKTVPVKAARKAKVRKAKKSVRFADDKTTISFRRISREELCDMWYQPAEYCEFDRSRRLTIAAVKEVNGNLDALDPQEHCVMGLEEQLTRKQILARRLRTVNYNRLVLEQQDLHRAFGGMQDISSVQQQQKAISDMFSRQALKRAQLRALLGEVQQMVDTEEF